MPATVEKLLEEQIQHVFAIIDAKINISATENEPLPFYDINEILKLEYENCSSLLRLSIKFKDDNNKYGSECDIYGNYFAMLWMYKNRKRLAQKTKKSADNILLMRQELYGLWQEDYEELEGIEMNNIESIDAYIIKDQTREVCAIMF